MPTEIVMPALGLAQESGRVLQWMAEEGQTVTAGEPLLEIETDKVTVELEAPATGVLSAVRASDGDEVPVGQVIALILAPGEAPPDAGPTAVLADAAPARERGGAGSVEAPAVGERRPSSPLARRRAREAGIDLAEVRGTGPGGAVTAADLESALAGDPEVSAAIATEPAGERPEVGALWRRMVERVSATWASAPHFYLSREVDAERLVAWRAALGESVTLTDLLVWLSARALERHPDANVVWDGDGPRRIDEVNVGVAVALDDGLVVPVVHRANELDVAEVAERLRDLVGRARGGTLRPEDVRGGTFTVSNLGMLGVDSFAAVVNGPQAAILAVGRVADRVVAIDRRPAVRPRMSLTLSCDHRSLDGARAARFLDTLTGVVEGPLGLVT